jgi:hypothetical protein
MSDEYQKAIKNVFDEPQRAARASGMFHEMREQEGLEYLNDWSPDELASKLKSFADGGNIKTGWNRWAAIQDGSDTDTSEYKF